MIIASMMLLQAVVVPSDQLREAERAYQACLTDGAKVQLASGATVIAAVRAAEPGCTASEKALRTAVFAQPSGELASVVPVQQARFEEAKRNSRMVVSSRLRRQQAK